MCALRHAHNWILEPLMRRQRTAARQSGEQVGWREGRVACLVDLPIFPSPSLSTAHLSPSLSSLPPSFPTPVIQDAIYHIPSSSPSLGPSAVHHVPCSRTTYRAGTLSEEEDEADQFILPHYARPSSEREREAGKMSSPPPLFFLNPSFLHFIIAFSFFGNILPHFSSGIGFRERAREPERAS